MSFALISESEAKKYQDQFLYAEQELAAAKGREHALQEKILKEIKESHEQLKKQILLCNELEVTASFVWELGFIV